MKHILLFCFIIMGHGLLHAQEANKSLKEIISLIEKETEYSFVYSENIDLSQRKDVVINEKTLKGILSLVFRNTGIAYKIDGKHVILKKETEKNSTGAVVPVICEGPPLQEVIIEENKNKPLSMASADVELTNLEILKTPSPFGEPDAIKALQLLPGIHSGAGSTSDFYVRGGDLDQNLVLLDGVSVYNSNHVKGFLSIFNGDAIQKTSLYKSEFPARFGGRLSSVVDIRSKTGNMQCYHGSLSLGMLSSHFNLEGPIVKNKTSFNVSMRRSYWDLILSLIDDAENFYVYDINAGITHKFSDKSLLHFNFYSGKDNIHEKISYLFTRQNNTDTRWGNTIASLRWDYKLSSGLFANTVIAYSGYKYRYDVSSSDYQTESSYRAWYRSGMQDWSIKTDWDFLPDDKHHIRFGAGHIFHTFKPEGSGSIQSTNTQNGVHEIRKDYPVESALGMESSLYVEDEIALSEQWKANAGIRFSAFNDQKRTRLSVLPRLSVGYEASRNLSFKASYAAMDQYIHLLGNGIISNPSDFWVPVITPGLPPMFSHQFTLGGFYDTKKGYSFSVEGFYKNMRNMLEYKDGYGWNSSVPWHEKTESGKGRSYGVEFFAQKTTGKLTGSLAYTLSRSDRQFPTINNGNRFPATYDRRHDLKINACYKFNQKIDFTAAWTFHSGSVHTLPAETYGMDLPEIINGSVWVDQYEERNNFRLPATHRLDLSMNYYRKKNAKGRQGIWNLTLYNVYATADPYAVVSYGPHVYKTSYMSYPIPSISYTYKF